MVDAGGRILVLAGPRGAGKTTACREAARLARGRGLSVGGVLCGSRRDPDGRPLEIEAESLATGERRLLASRELELDGPRWPPHGASRDAVPPFSFSSDCFAWALGLLREEARADLVVLDEIGPLELTLHAGFRPFMDELAARPVLGALLATVRVELAAGLVELAAFGHARRYDLDLSNRSAIPAEAAREAALRFAERNVFKP